MFPLRVHHVLESLKEDALKAKLKWVPLFLLITSAARWETQCSDNVVKFSFSSQISSHINESADHVASHEGGSWSTLCPRVLFGPDGSHWIFRSIVHLSQRKSIQLSLQSTSPPHEHYLEACCSYITFDGWMDAWVWKSWHIHSWSWFNNCAQITGIFLFIHLLGVLKSVHFSPGSEETVSNTFLWWSICL